VAPPVRAAVLTGARGEELSGQAAIIGHFAAVAGAGPAFLPPVLGRFGVAASGQGTRVFPDVLGGHTADCQPGQVVWGDR
jgi:hypothetical protein